MNETNYVIEINGYKIKDRRVGDLSSLTSSDKTTVVDAINSNKSAIDTTIGDLSSLETSNKTSVVNSINSLKSATDNALNTKETALTELVIFGDSWSDPTVTDAIWGDLAGQELGLNVNNYAISGAYMSGSSADSLSSQVSTFNNSDVDKSKVKYIVILGGINDYRNSVAWNTLCNDIEAQITLLKGYCPQAKILLVTNMEYPYTVDQGKYWCGVHQEIRTTSKIVGYNMFGTMGNEFFNSANYFHLNQTGQKMMLSNIIASLTGGEIVYWQDEVVRTSNDCDFKYSTQRVGNMVYCHFTLIAKANFDNVTFNAPTNFNFSYSDAYGGVGGWSDSNYKQVAYDLGANSVVFAVNNNAISGKIYHYLWCIPLVHLD